MVFDSPNCDVDMMVSTLPSSDATSWLAVIGLADGSEASFHVPTKLGFDCAASAVDITRLRTTRGANARFMGTPVRQCYQQTGSHSTRHRRARLPATTSNGCHDAHLVGSETADTRHDLRRDGRAGRWRGNLQ